MNRNYCPSIRLHQWLSWLEKTQEESNFKSLHVQQSVSRMQGLNKKTYFYYNRSGLVHQLGKCDRLQENRA